MKIISNGSEGWKTLFGVVSTLSEEVLLDISKENITVKSLDISHVAIMSVVWNKKDFKTYDVDSDISIGVRTSEVNKILKKSDGDVELSVTDGNNLILKIGDKKEFQFNIIHPESISMTPKIKDDAVSFDITREQFSDIIDDVATFGVYLSIDVKPTDITFTGIGDVGKSKTRLDISTGKTAAGRYSIEYIQSILSSTPKSIKNINLAFSPSNPIRIQFKVPDMGPVDYYLAPRND